MLFNLFCKYLLLFTSFLFKFFFIIDDLDFVIDFLLEDCLCVLFLVAPFIKKVLELVIYRLYIEYISLVI